jgi:small subunit ribosomal protein S6
MLDPQLDAPARDALAQEARGQIEGSGALKHENAWGLRKMAYEINRRTEADYRWMRFEAPRELLDTLDHNLKIADGVLRFRIFKVDPSAPVIVPPAATAPGPRERSAGGGREEHGDSAEDAEAGATPEAESPAGAEAESAAGAEGEDDAGSADEGVAGAEPDAVASTDADE